MIYLCISAFFGSFVLHSAALAAPSGCIQPETVLVHQELRLIDLWPASPGDVIERSSGLPEIQFIDDAKIRIRLRDNEQIRLRSADGTTTGWRDPLIGIVASPEAEQTPAWVMGAVWYNIFPERFDNAEPRNDQGWPHGTPADWTSDWFAVTADEFEASANRAIADPMRYGDDPDRNRPPLGDVVFERRYGGDIQGIQRRLDHIASLGVTALWLCPIFESTSLHKYDATDHRHIDPNLAWPGAPRLSQGPFSPDKSQWKWTPADRAFIDGFLPAAHDKGLRVILDGAWNHAGTAHPAFVDAVERGAASPFGKWFDLKYDQYQRVVGWRAWDRQNGNLPVFGQKNDDLAVGPKQYVFDVTSRWMDPDGDGDPTDGIDGWRLDVANEIGLPFWKDWRRHVRSLNEDAVLIGELWFDGRDYFGGKAFDSQMNYPVAFVLVPWLAGTPNPDIADDLADAFDHHPATVLAQMNLLGSHDTARLVSMLANPGLGYDQGAGMGDSGFDRSRPSPEVYNRLELAYAVLTVLPGSPMVFAGDELGVWGGDDPENRKPLPWPDLIGDQSLVELAEETNARAGNWLRLRSDNEVGPVLRYGGCRLWTEQGVLVIERDLDGQRLRLYANSADIPMQSTIGQVGPRSARLVSLTQLDTWVDIRPASEKP